MFKKTILFTAIVLTLTALTQRSYAAISTTGDVAPADPATWTSSTDGYIGNTSDGTMDITAGSDVVSDHAFIGNNFGSTGAVTVDGPGSTWINSDRLRIGHYGNGTMTITNGGAVSNTYGEIGVEFGSIGEVTVDGFGSTWTSSNNLSVGDYMGDGTLNIRSGGEVRGTSGYIGAGFGSTGQVTVDGSGSIWTNSDNFYVGYNGDGTLNITNGGAVTVEGYTSVSKDYGSSGAINFNNGTLTTGALFCSFDDLTGTGTINAHGLVSDIDLVFDASHGLNQTFNLNDTAQNIALNLDINGSGPMGTGYSGTGTMRISDGINVGSTTGYIGYKFGSTGTVTVEGSGSTWTNSDDLYVGNYGNGTLNITNGGSVSNTFGYIGHESGSTGEVTVDGTGSTWTNSGFLRVGYYGDGTLNITNGGKVSNTSCYIGTISGPTGAVTVDGSGSIWTNSEELDVRGTLTITNGGAVSSTSGYVTHYSGFTGEVTVDGSGSIWTNSGGLRVNGPLNIKNGGAVSSTSGSIATYSGSTGAVTVDGSGSKWTNNTYGLYVGDDGDGTLAITNGGAVNNGYGYIGRERGSTGAVTVDGSDSKWTNRSGLHVGWYGDGTLEITNGGAVSNALSSIATRPSSTGKVTVDGSGSVWTNSDDLIVGFYGAGTLNITDGGLVSVAGALNIDDNGGDDSFVNMATGGALALYDSGWVSGETLDDFLALISGTGAINYWDGSAWAGITGATYGVDYTLDHLTTGDLTDYTVLTVGVPEPATLLLLGLGGILIRKNR